MIPEQNTPVGVGDPRVELLDQLVAQREGIDHFCSTSAWGLAAYFAFRGERPSRLVLHAEEGFAAAFAEVFSPTGAVVWLPWDSAWLLGSPIINAGPRFDVPAAVDFLRLHHGLWNVCVVSGLSTHDHAADRLRDALPVRYRARAIDRVERNRASLLGGWDGFMARRSTSFRTGLRADLRRAAAAGVTTQCLRPSSVAELAQLLRRAHRVEAESWKGLSGFGVHTGTARAFTDSALARGLYAGAEVRCVVASIGEQDIAYVHGTVQAGVYRGMSVTFADGYRALAPGNIVQAAMIAWLAEDGVPWYDLGSTLPYKTRWGEDVLATDGLAIWSS